MHLMYKIVFCGSLSEHNGNATFGLGIIVKLNLREMKSLWACWLDGIEQLQVTQPVHGAGIFPTAVGLRCFHILKQNTLIHM